MPFESNEPNVERTPRNEMESSLPRSLEMSFRRMPPLPESPLQPDGTPASPSDGPGSPALVNTALVDGAPSSFGFVAAGASEWAAGSSLTISFDLAVSEPESEPEPHPELVSEPEPVPVDAGGDFQVDLPGAASPHP